MNEHELRGLIGKVKAGKLSRRGFMQRMTAVGISVPFAAHMLAHLRIADVVTDAVARLATGLTGYSLAGRVSHPLDDVPNFVITACSYSFRTSLAWSQRPAVLVESH